MERHDVPPPPYSETDIYASSDHHSSSSDPALTRPHTQADDASSSRSNIIYTPPDTPQDSHHAFSGAEDVQTTASAQVYFDARAAADHLRASAPIVHTISVSDDPCPADFPLPAWAASRDVNPQDWRTFINYLIPDYADKANIGIIDRKSRPSGEDGPSTSAPRDTAPAPRLDDLKSSSQRRLADTVKEWNGGFFGPRVVSIRLLEETSQGEPKARMPSGSVRDDAAGVQERDASAVPQQQQTGGWMSMLSQRLGMTMNDRGLRMGPLTIDNDRVAFGSSFEADGRGVRWNGRDIAEQFSSGGGRGRGQDRDPRGSRGRGRWWHDGSASYPHQGGHMDATEGRRRSQSVSSNGSSSSSDSESTVSSIGSLPDWDDLRDSQMPVVKQSVEAWLARPEHIVTKAELKRAKAQIKAAKSLPQPAAPSDARQREEIKSLLSRFGDLKKHQRAGLKTARKEARAQRRAEKRTRKARNRGEEKEERRHKREHKRAEREQSRRRRRNGKAPEVPSPQQRPGPTITPPFAPGAHPAHLFPAEHQFGPGPSLFGPGRSGGPGFSFGGGWGPGGHHHHQWPPSPSHPHVAAEGSSSRAAAQSHAAAAREQAFRARAAAHEQAIQARARAHEMAVHHRAAAHEEAVRARAQAAEHRDRALSQAEQARASAAAEAARERYAAKYRAAGALEQEMEGKRVALRALQESAEAMAVAAARDGRGDQKRAGPSQMERNAEALERELEDLGCRIEELVFEADEDFAKSLESDNNTRDEKSKVRWLE